MERGEGGNRQTERERERVNERVREIQREEVNYMDIHIHSRII